MGKRSPILGFNHNVKHRGVVFHVQTEDSGVDNPHLFTHLFHKGTILNSKKLEYDSSSSVDVVKALMQAQHKSVLKELKNGTYDAKIDDYLSSHPDLLPAASDTEETPRQSQFTSEDVDPALNNLTDEPAAAVYSPPPESAPRPPGLKDKSRRRFARRTSQPPPFRDGAETTGVIVSRPAVIVGTPRKQGRAATAAQTQAARRKRVDTAKESLFGEEIISEKSLDDVILAYLSEDKDE